MSPADETDIQSIVIPSDSYFCFTFDSSLSGNGEKHCAGCGVEKNKATWISCCSVSLPFSFIQALHCRVLAINRISNAMFSVYANLTVSQCKTIANTMSAELWQFCL